MSKIEFEPTDNKVGCFIYTNLKEVKKDQIDEIKKLLNKYGVLFFKNQSLGPFFLQHMVAGGGLSGVYAFECVDMCSCMYTHMIR